MKKKIAIGLTLCLIGVGAHLKSMQSNQPSTSKQSWQQQTPGGQAPTSPTLKMGKKISPDVKNFLSLVEDINNLVNMHKEDPQELALQLKILEKNPSFYNAMHSFRVQYGIKETKQLPSANDIRYTALAAHEKFIAVNYTNNDTNVVRISDNNTWRVRKYKKVKSLALNPQANKIAIKYSISKNKHQITILDLNTDKGIKAWPIESDENNTIVLSKSPIKMATVIHEENFQTDIEKVTIEVRNRQGHAAPTKLVISGKNLLGYANFAITPDGSKLVSVGPNNTLAIWDIANQKIIKEIPVANILRAINISSDGKKIISAFRNNTIQIHNLKSGKLISVLRTPTTTISSIAYLVDTDETVTLSRDGTVQIFKPNTFRNILQKRSQ